MSFDKTISSEESNKHFCNGRRIGINATYGSLGIVNLLKGLNKFGINGYWILRKILKGDWIIQSEACFGFTQCEVIDYTKTCSPISSNDSFTIIMALMTHSDTELHQ